MNHWGKTPEEWYDLPREARIQLRAQYEGNLILNGLREHDRHEDAKREAESKARSKGRH